MLIKSDIMKKGNLSLLLAGMLTLALTIFSFQSFSVIIYVDQNAAGANNGTSWDDAFTELHQALAAASYGDEIWVAQGVYRPVEVIDLNGSGGVDPREAVFFLPNGVALYGGFAGTESALEERNWETNLTILSGDIDNNDLDVDGNFIAENSGDIIGNNSYHVLLTENADPSTRVDGFIVTAGKADIALPEGVNDPNLDGGGWYNRLSPPTYSSSPTIVNTSFIGNYAESEGGAFYSAPGPAGGESSPLIENCLFSGNKSNHSGGALYIGSFSPGNYQPVVLNCRFAGNEAYRIGGAVYFVGDQAEVTSSRFENNLVTVISPDMNTLPGSGGAVALVASGAVFTSSMFFGNSSTGNPTGASEGGGGGAVYVSTNEPQTLSLGASEPRFIGCGFYDNTASGNGAAWGGAITFKNDDGIMKPEIINCVFSGNEAQDRGGAVFCYTRVVGTPDEYIPILNPVFTNCTFYGNNAGERGGAIYNQGFNYMGSQVLESVILNSILWGNDAGVEGDEIYSTGNGDISYSLVEGSGGSGIGWDTSLGNDGGNNLDVNPGFVNAVNPMGADGIPATIDDGLRLSQHSAAVNAGDNSASGLAGITTDYTGGFRILGGTVDMGAYERSGIILPDFDFVWLFDWPGVQPPCFTCPLPWSFLLFREFGFDPHYVLKEPAKFIRDGNSAVITGEIENAADPQISFKIYLKLEREHSWEKWSRQQGSWFSETEESNAMAKSEHVNWIFWRLSTSSFLEGTGEIEGILQLKQWSSSEKTGFQMGMGANARDEDFGLAGYFTYNGKLMYQGKKLQVKGLGSLNVDGVPCEDDCGEQFNLPTAEKGFKTGKNAQLPLIEKKSGIKIYPVPAGEFLILESGQPGEGISVVKIQDASGRLLLTEEWDRKESRHTIRLDNLKNGIHFIQVLHAHSDEGFIEKFVKK